MGLGVARDTQAREAPAGPGPALASLARHAAAFVAAPPATFGLSVDRPGPGPDRAANGSTAGPVGAAPCPPTRTTPNALAAINRLNYYRAMVGAEPLCPHEALIASSQNHADYILRNYADRSAFPNDNVHLEAEGKPGFTGVTSGDRSRAAGFPWNVGGEVLVTGGAESYPDPTIRVEILMTSFGHRARMLDPANRFAGYGQGVNERQSIGLMNLGGWPTGEDPTANVTPYPLGFPADGATNSPVEHDFTVYGVGGPLRVDAIELRDASGQALPTDPRGAGCSGQNCVGMVPVGGLKPGTTYVAYARGAVGAVPFERTWRFTIVSELTFQRTAVWVPNVKNNAPDHTFGGTWRTGLQVLNLTKDRPANVRLRFLSSDGAEVAASAVQVLAAAKAQTFFGAGLGAPEGFGGSVIVDSNTPVAVIANGLSERGATSFAGVPLTQSRTDYEAGYPYGVPIALRNANGVSSALVLQNASPYLARLVYLRFIRLGETSGPEHILPAPLPPGATYELPLAAVPSLDDGWQGSVAIRADQRLAIVVNQSNGQSNRRSYLAANGWPIQIGASRLYGPLVMNNNGGFSSSIHVQNGTFEAVSVTLKLYSSATGAKVAEQTRRLTTASATAWTVAELLGNDDPFVGSVTVEAGTNEVILGVVNQMNAGANQASAYSMFTRGTATVVAPLVQTANGGWSSGFQVQNVGATAAAVTVAATDTSGNAVTVPNDTRTIPPGKSETWFPLTRAGVPFVGSAVATSPAGSQLVGIVNQLNVDASAVDFFTTYEALNQ
ncbi:MAG: CAP domain-containing protein [Chloroflexi bacterium]|nr:CAP domain-containing protein [Chloroflexota bacterium]